MIITVLSYVFPVIAAYLLGWLNAWWYCQNKRKKSVVEMPDPVVPAEEDGWSTAFVPEEPELPHIPKNKAVVFKNPKGQWRWRVRANNNKVIATSGESYHNRSDAAETLHSVLTNTEVVDDED